MTTIELHVLYNDSEIKGSIDLIERLLEKNKRKRVISRFRIAGENYNWIEVGPPTYY